MLRVLGKNVICDSRICQKVNFISDQDFQFPVRMFSACPVVMGYSYYKISIVLGRGLVAG